MRKTQNPSTIECRDIPDFPGYRVGSDGSVWSSQSPYGEGLMEKWYGKVHCGDCVEMMARMPTNSVGAIVTSPPYNIRNSTGNGLKDGRGGKWKSAALINGYAEHDDNMPHEEYVAWQRRCLGAMMRVLREDGAIFYNHKWRVQGGLLQDRSDIVSGFPVRQIIIWQRDGGFNFNPGYFLPTYEVIYLICKPGFKLAPKANAVGDVWHIAQESKNPHPAPFPVELAQRCIGATTARIVLDPFMGSGTTAIAAESYAREWIGIDIAQEYCKLAKERILAARGGYTGDDFTTESCCADVVGTMLDEPTRRGCVTGEIQEAAKSALSLTPFSVQQHNEDARIGRAVQHWRERACAAEMMGDYEKPFTRGWSAAISSLDKVIAQAKDGEKRG